MTKELRKLSRKDKIRELKRYYASEMAEDPEDGTQFDTDISEALNIVTIKYYPRAMTGKEEWIEDENFGTVCPNCDNIIKKDSNYCPRCQYQPPSKRRENICPVCQHPFKDHRTVKNDIWLDSKYTEENRRDSYQLICQVPECDVNPKQEGVCFSSIPDDLIQDYDPKWITISYKIDSCRECHLGCVEDAV